MDKQECKRYLISEIGLYIGGFVIFFAALHFLSGSERSSITLTAAQAVLSALALALVPAGNYAGIVFFGTKIKELKTKHAVLLIVFLPLALAFVTAAGVLLLLPTAMSAAIKIHRG